MARRGRSRRLAKAIIYIRVSMAREEMHSPEQQLYACEKYAKEQGIEIVGEPVQDLDMTGRSFARRQIAQLIERVRAGEADCVLVWKWSRFGRNNYESQVNLRSLEEAGGVLVAVTEDFDTGTTHGHFSRDQMLLIADLQSGMISDTWTETHARRRRNGLPHTGQARFGYQRCPDCRRKEDAPNQFHYCHTCHGVLQIDPVRGPALREAYERFVGDEPMSTVARDMTDRGIRSLMGNVMGSSNWFTAMDSGFAAGLLRGRTNWDVKHPNNKPSTYDLWEPGKHEPLISVELWERYKVRRENHHVEWDRSPKYAMSGLTRCKQINVDGKVCNAHMVAAKVMPRRPSGASTLIFRCSQISLKGCRGVTVTVKRLDDAIETWLAENARGEEQGAAAMQRAARRQAASSALEDVKRQLAVKEREHKRLLDLYLRELLTEVDFRDKRDEIEAEIAGLKSRLAVLTEAAGPGAMATAEDFRGLLKTWPQMTTGARRTALRHVINRIDVYPTPGKQQNKIVVVPKGADELAAVP